MKACDVIRMKKYAGLIVFLIILLLVSAAGFYLYSLKITDFTFKNGMSGSGNGSAIISVSGSNGGGNGTIRRYNDEELKEMIFTTKLEYNPLYWIFFKKEDKEIPFIAKYDVDIEWPNKANVTVYEKDIVGYVYYKDFYIYFDKDGIVVESSTKLIDNAILVEGLELKQMVLYQKLPAVKAGSFELILSITKMIRQNELKVDKIYFDHDLNITLYTGNIKIALGADEYLDEKMTKVRLLLPSLEGYSGTLNLENYKDGNNSFYFRSENG